MAIKITQTCDGCGEERMLTVGFANGYPSIAKAADQGGWRNVLNEKHLCRDCLRAAVNN